MVNNMNELKLTEREETYLTTHSINLNELITVAMPTDIYVTTDGLVETKTYLAELIKAWKKDRTLKDFGISAGLGLCSNILARFCTDRMKDFMFETWPKFSGDYNFPIPSPKSKVKARSCYHEAEDKYKGAYGKSRIELARHCKMLLTIMIRIRKAQEK